MDGCDFDMATLYLERILAKNFVVVVSDESIFFIYFCEQPSF